MIDKKLKIANKKFKSRLIVGTGKYKSFNECARAIKSSGAEIVTVAVRRVNISCIEFMAKIYPFIPNPQIIPVTTPLIIDL